MTLKQGKNNKTYQVLSINIELLLERRLEALGLTEGAKITILNNNKKRCSYRQISWHTILHLAKESQTTSK